MICGKLEIVGEKLCVDVKKVSQSMEKIPPSTQSRVISIYPAIVTPSVLDVKEHKFIHLLNSLKPNGLNIDNPFAVPIFHR